jgi:hypothetical protein
MASASAAAAAAEASASEIKGAHVGTGVGVAALASYVDGVTSDACTDMTRSMRRLSSDGWQIAVGATFHTWSPSAKRDVALLQLHFTRGKGDAPVTFVLPINLRADPPATVTLLT